MECRPKSLVFPTCHPWNSQGFYDREEEEPHCISNKTATVLRFHTPIKRGGIVNNNQPSLAKCHFCAKTREMTGNWFTTVCQKVLHNLGERENLFLGEPLAWSFYMHVGCIEEKNKSVVLPSRGQERCRFSETIFFLSRVNCWVWCCFFSKKSHMM